jgi:hypothetical protein
MPCGAKTKKYKNNKKARHKPIQGECNKRPYIKLGCHRTAIIVRVSQT